MAAAGLDRSGYGRDVRRQTCPRPPRAVEGERPATRRRGRPGGRRAPTPASQHSPAAKLRIECTPEWTRRSQTDCAADAGVVITPIATRCRSHVSFSASRWSTFTPLIVVDRRPSRRHRRARRPGSPATRSPRSPKAHGQGCRRRRIATGQSAVDGERLVDLAEQHATFVASAAGAVGAETREVAAAGWPGSRRRRRRAGGRDVTDAALDHHFERQAITRQAIDGRAGNDAVSPHVRCSSSAARYAAETALDKVFWRAQLAGSPAASRRRRDSGVAIRLR